MSADERTRLRALRKTADLAPCEAFRDDNTGLWTVREREAPQGEIVAEVLWTDVEPMRDGGATEARARLFASVGAALPALLDALDAADRAVERAGGACGRLRRERDDARAEVETLRAEAALMREQLAAATARVEELEESAAMACQSPADDCDCAGCLYAAERGGES